MNEQKLVELDEFVKGFDSKVAAAKALEVQWWQLNRWLRRRTFADNNSRKLAAMKGVALPERPDKGAA